MLRRNPTANLAPCFQLNKVDGLWAVGSVQRKCAREGDRFAYVPNYEPAMCIAKFYLDIKTLYPVSDTYIKYLLTICHETLRLRGSLRVR